VKRLGRTQNGQLALAAGYTVTIAASGPADQTAMIADLVTRCATASTVAAITDGADVVILAALQFCGRRVLQHGPWR